MLKFGTGFDWMETSSDAASAFALWGWYGLPGGPLPATMEIVSPGRFDAGKCLMIANSNVSSEDTQASCLLGSSYENDVFFMGAAMYVPSNGEYTKPFIGVGRSGTALLTVALCEFGVLELWMGRETYPLGTLLASSSPGSYRTDTWNYIEIGGLLINTTAGYATVRVNTVPKIELVSTVTQPDDLQFNSVMIGYMFDRETGQSTPDTKWDDMYLCDDNGVRNNSFLGNIRVQAQLPASNSTPITWSPYPGILENWEAATNVAVNDDSYVYSNTTGDYDLYNVTPLLNTPEVFGITVRGAYRQTDATQQSVYNLISSDGVLEEGAQFFTPGTYAFSSDIYEVDPATETTWLYTAVNLLKIGPRIGGFTFLDIGTGNHLNIGNGGRFLVS